MRFAIIGLGGRITDVVHHFLAAAGGRATCVAYADPAPIGLEKARRYGFDPGTAYADHRRMLEAEKPDVVFVGSPNFLHLTHQRDALEAGCRVFSEKPAVTTIADTMEAARMVRRHGADRLLIGLVLRSSPMFRAVRALIAEGRIGKLVSLETNEHLMPEHGGFIQRDWRRKQLWSGGYLLEKCCHDFDLYQGIAGTRAQRVAGFAGRSIFTPENIHLEQGDAKRYRQWGKGWSGIDRVFDGDGDVWDHQVALVEYGNDVRLSFHSNTHAAYYQRRWLIAGLEGAIECDLPSSRLKVQRVYGQSEERDLNTRDGHGGADPEMGKDLAATLFDGKPFPAQPRAALEAGLTCMAIDQAVREGRVVDMAPLWAEFDAAYGG